jgi:hypothetical protein
MNGRGLAVVFAEDVPTIKGSDRKPPGKKSTLTIFVKFFLNRG